MTPVTDPALAALVVELVEKTALLRRDVQKAGDREKYAARLARVELKVTQLAAHVEASDPELAKALRTAWERPAMSLAFRNAAHQKDE